MKKIIAILVLSVSLTIANESELKAIKTSSVEYKSSLYLDAFLFSSRLFLSYDELKAISINLTYEREISSSWTYLLMPSFEYFLRTPVSDYILGVRITSHKYFNKNHNSRGFFLGAGLGYEFEAWDGKIDRHYISINSGLGYAWRLTSRFNASLDLGIDSGYRAYANQENAFGLSLYLNGNVGFGF